jgi:hypothetical protein
MNANQTELKGLVAAINWQQLLADILPIILALLGQLYPAPPTPAA